MLEPMDQIELFLKEIKQLLAQGKYDFLDRREHNKRTLLALGLDVKMVVQFLIDELSAGDLYRRGVEIEDPKLKAQYGQLFACEFKKSVSDADMELFIRLAKVYGQEQVVIISFHESVG